MSGVIPRFELARGRAPLFSDLCNITPPIKTGRNAQTNVPCSVQTPSLKLGHGYGHEGGGPTALSRRVTKSIYFDLDVDVQAGDVIEWVDGGEFFEAGEDATASTLEPYVMVNATLKGPRQL